MNSDLINQTQSVIDGISAPIFMMVPASDGRLVYAAFNKVAQQATQLSLDDVVGHTAKEVFKGHTGESADKHAQEAFCSGKFTCYMTVLPIEDKLLHVRTELTPHRNSDGQVTYLMGVSQEVTAEHNLASMRSNNRAMENDINDFIRLAAHDMRSPIIRISSLVNVIREDFQDLGDGKLEAINMVEQVGINALSMVERVLGHVKSASSEQPINGLFLPDMCQSVVTTLDPLTQYAYDIDECSYQGDCVLLQLILQNLFDNAIKHNSTLERQLCITVTAKSLPYGFCSIRVTDNGQSVQSPDTLFSDEDKNRANSGFGLFAIRRLLKARAGDIYASHGSNGQGLSVTCFLPGTVSAFAPSLAA